MPERENQSQKDILARKGMFDLDTEKIVIRDVNNPQGGTSYGYGVEVTVERIPSTGSGHDLARVVWRGSGGNKGEEIVPLDRVRINVEKKKPFSLW